MAFTPNNNFNANMNNGGEKKKTNFAVGKQRSSDGILSVDIWVSDSGVVTILTIKQSVGNDPSTGAPVLEQKKPSELPRFFLSLEYLEALIKALDEEKDPGTLNICIDKTKFNGGKLSIVGNGTSVKFTIDGAKNGSRSTTFNAVATGSKNIHAAVNIIKEYLKLAYKKALFQRLDPEEFDKVIGSSQAEDNDDTPFT